jgi:hypothetical protein
MGSRPRTFPPRSSLFWTMVLVIGWNSMRVLKLEVGAAATILATYSGCSSLMMLRASKLLVAIPVNQLAL